MCFLRLYGKGLSCLARGTRELSATFAQGHGSERLSTFVFLSLFPRKIFLKACFSINVGYNFDSVCKCLFSGSIVSMAQYYLLVFSPS